jgi:NADH-quinone oxidoreductase subunit G
MAMLEAKLPAYLLMNLEPELDCWDGQLALESLQSAELVVAMTSYTSKAMNDYADVLLPVSCYAENEGSFYNMSAQQQSFNMVVPPQGESRPGWKVLRVLGNILECDGMDYKGVTEVRDELDTLVGDVAMDNLTSNSVPENLQYTGHGLQRTTDFPMNSADSLVRRAAALQQTGDVADGSVHINANEAARLGVEQDDNAAIKQNGYEYVLPVVIDNQLSDDTVLIQAGAIPAPFTGDITVGKA